MTGMSVGWWRGGMGALVVVVVALSGCAVGSPAEAFAGRSAPLLGPAAPLHIGADDVTLLRGGVGTFAVLRSVVDSALRSVDVEVYELGQPALVTALINAHQ